MSKSINLVLYSQGEPFNSTKKLIKQLIIILIEMS